MELWHLPCLARWQPKQGSLGLAARTEFAPDFDSVTTASMGMIWSCLGTNRKTLRTPEIDVNLDNCAGDLGIWVHSDRHYYYSLRPPLLLLNNQSIFNEACVTAGSSARVSEQRKHASNDVKCSELRWSCIPFGC